MLTMNERTISSAEGWLNCGAFAKDTSPPGPSAIFGTEVHAMVEGSIANDPTVPMGTPKHRRVAAGAVAWLRGLAIPLRPEVAYAIALDGSVRTLGERIGRAYEAHGATPDDICGSADLVGEGESIDLKTGREASYEKHAAQLDLLAYCVARTQGRDTVRSTALHATEKAATPYARTLDAIDLGAIGHRLHLARSLPEVPSAGRHCDKAYCGARATCPAYLDMRVREAS